MEIKPNKHLDTEATDLINEMDELMSVAKGFTFETPEDFEEWKNRYFKARDGMHKWQGKFLKYANDGAIKPYKKANENRRKQVKKATTLNLKMAEDGS